MSRLTTIALYPLPDRLQQALRFRHLLQVLATRLEQLGTAVAALEQQQLMAWHRSDPVSQRLASIPGIGPIIATARAATVVEPIGFASGREFAAWLGLVPREHSTGGKARLGSISKRGNQYLRRLLINGASANLLRSQDSTHRLGGDVPRGELPAAGGGSISHRRKESLREGTGA